MVERKTDSCCTDDRAATLQGQEVCGAPGDSYECLVSRSPQGSIYCRRWWLDAVAPESYRILTVERGGKLLAAWPIVSRQQHGRTDVVMPQMTQKLGILFSPSEAKYAEQLSTQHQLVSELIDQLPVSGSFEHRFHEEFTNWLPFFWRGFEQTTRYTYALTNIKDQDRLWKEMRTSGRTTVRRASRNGLVVRDNLDFDAFLDLYDQTFSRQGKETPVSRRVLKRIDEACSAHAGRRVFAARDSNNRLHAAVYIMWHNGTAYYLMAGSDPDLRGSGGATLALWEAVKQVSTVADTFDFEGSMMPRVESAIRDLGGRQRPYFAISKPAPPTLMGIAHDTARACKRWVRVRLRSI